MGESNTTAKKKITISFDEVYGAGDAYNYNDNNTSLSYDTCACMRTLTVTFSRKDRRNDMLYTPNTLLINVRKALLESPIVLKKREKAYFEQSWIKRDKSFHWEKVTPRCLISDRKRWLWTKKKIESCSYDRENKKQIADSVYTWQNAFVYTWGYPRLSIEKLA